MERSESIKELAKVAITNKSTQEDWEMFLSLSNGEFELLMSLIEMEKKYAN